MPMVGGLPNKNYKRKKQLQILAVCLFWTGRELADMLLSEQEGVKPLMYSNVDWDEKLKKAT